MSSQLNTTQLLRDVRDGSRTAFDDLPFPTRPLYAGRPASARTHSTPAGERYPSSPSAEAGTPSSVPAGSGSRRWSS